MYVHRQLGRGYPEIIYQRALAIEMRLAGLQFEQEKQMDVQYREIIIGKRNVDFIVDGEVLVELKATSELDDSHFVQILNYLQMHSIEIGLLMNFGGKSLEFKRVYNNNLD